MKKLLDLWLKPLEWFDITQYSDGTPVTPEDRFAYRLTSFCLVILVLVVVLIALGAIL